jgi:alcohol dehydrogenase class IV
LLTAATGIDALSHLLEAWFVPPVTVLFLEEGGTADGYLSKADVARCDNFALEGIDLVISNLPTAFKV